MAKILPLIVKAISRLIPSKGNPKTQRNSENYRAKWDSFRMHPQRILQGIAIVHD